MLELAVTAALMLPAKADPVVSFATYNVCKTSCGTGRFAWDRRKKATVRTIVSAKPDVLALQEADNSYLYYEEALRRHGYKRVQPDTDVCTDGCVPDSQLFYRPTVTPIGRQVPSEPRPSACLPYPPKGPVEPVDQDYPPYPPAGSDPALVRQWEQLRAQIRAANDAADFEYYLASQSYERAGCAAYADWTPFTTLGSRSNSLAEWAESADLARSAQDRNIMWSLFKHKRTGAAFLAVSIHLPNEKTPQAEQYRKSLAKSLTPKLSNWRSRVGAGKVPTIVMGDLNSFAYRQPRGAHWILGRSGFKDAYSAARKVNGDVTTVNTSATNRDPFPASPRRSDTPTRLDYVMFDKGRALRYEVHIRLKSGRFDNRYRGSDHNLVKATLKLPHMGLPKRFDSTPG